MNCASTIYKTTAGVFFNGNGVGGPDELSGYVSDFRINELLCTDTEKGITV